jgi:hypothetical protein
MRRALTAAACVSTLSSAVLAQTTLFTVTGVANDNQLGTSVSYVGDLNADGRAEFVVGAIEQGIFSSGQGYARVCNGSTGLQLFNFDGATNGDAFGTSVSASDINADGKPDIVVGAPNATSTGGGAGGGRAYIYNGATGSTTPMFTLNGLVGGGHFGTSVAGAGDVNGDGKGDVIVGAPDTNTSKGRAVVFSGASGAVLWTIDGLVNNDGFGSSVDGIGDINGDGRSDFIVGSRLAGAKIYSGMTGLQLGSTISANGNDRRGAAVAGAGDVSGDGVPDYIVGAPQDGSIFALGTGYATVYNGATAAVIYTVNGDAVGDRFGMSVGGGRLVNTGDARVDFIVGADQNNNGAIGYARVFSGLTGSPIHTVFGLNGGDRLGTSVDVLGDLNLDGGGEFIAGAPKTSVGSFTIAGIARVYSFENAAAAFDAFCFGDGADVTHTAACPCGNNGASGHGCAHSFSALGGLLTVTGTTTADDVVLTASDLPATSFALFMQHDAAGDQVFHDGVLCASGGLVRLRGRAAVAGTVAFPDNSFAQDSTTTLSQRGGVTVGSGLRRYYASWYRNASTTFCPPATANVTNGFKIDW